MRPGRRAAAGVVHPVRASTLKRRHALCSLPFRLRRIFAVSLTRESTQALTDKGLIRASELSGCGDRWEPSLSSVGQVATLAGSSPAVANCRCASPRVSSDTCCQRTTARTGRAQRCVTGTVGTRFTQAALGRAPATRPTCVDRDRSRAGGAPKGVMTRRVGG